MKEKKVNNQKKLNELKSIRKQEYDNSEEKKAMTFNKVEFLGIGKLSNKELYRVIESFSVAENETEDNCYYYEFKDNEFKLIARNIEKEIIPTGDFLKQIEEGKEKITWDSIREDIVKCEEERNMILQLLAEKYDLKEDEINSLSEIDLEQKIIEKEQEDKEEKKEEQNEDERQQISEEEAEEVGIKDNGLNSAKMDTRIDNSANTLGKELGLEEYDSIMVVHSYKLAQLQDSEGKKGNVNNINFALVGKKKDGTLEIIPETKLRQYRGENREVTEINNREEVEVKNEDCIFEVPNTNKRIAINQKDPYGIPEIYYGKSDKENDGNVMQGVKGERYGTQEQDVEVRALFNSNKGEYQIDKMHEEVKGHVQEECNNIKEGEMDGNDTTGHQHPTEGRVITTNSCLFYDGETRTVSEIATSPRFNTTPEEFCKKYNSIKAKNGDMPEEDIFNEIERQLIEDMHSPQKR